MDSSLSRPKRIRVKPLRFWDNERIKYDISGKIIDTSSLSITSSFAYGNYSLENKKVNNIGKNILKKNEKNKKKNNESVHSKTIQVIREKSLPKKKDAKTIKNYKSSGGKKGKDASIIEKKSLSKLDATNSSKKNDSVNVLKNSSELDKFKKPTKIPSRGRKKKLETLNSLIEKDEKKPHQNYASSELEQDNTDISQLKYVVDDYKVFQLKEMYLLRNNFGEDFYVSKGVTDSQMGLQTGFLCFKGQQFHYDGGLTKDIFVVRGEGSIEVTQKGTGLMMSKPMFKGAKFRVFQGDEILLRKNDDSPVVMLFLSFKLN